MREELCDRSETECKGEKDEQRLKDRDNDLGRVEG